MNLRCALKPCCWGRPKNYLAGTSKPENSRKYHCLVQFHRDFSCGKFGLKSLTNLGPKMKRTTESYIFYFCAEAVQ